MRIESERAPARKGLHERQRARINPARASRPHSRRLSAAALHSLARSLAFPVCLPPPSASVPFGCSQAFGATIFLSILFSFVYALGLFVPLLLEFGPLPQRVKGHTGDLDDSGDDGNFEPAGNGGADWQHQPMLDSSYFDSADHSETMHTPPEMSPRPVHGAASNGVATANGLASRPARSSAVEQY
jgi:hypothetical protein